MTIERAIEILDPEHREHYTGIEEVNHACRMGIDALEKQRPRKPTGTHYSQRRCPACKARVRSGGGSSSFTRDNWCSKCGQRLDWSVANAEEES